MSARLARLLAAIGVCLSIAGLLFIATKASAQEAKCGEMSAMVDYLKSTFDEEIVWSGTTDMDGVKYRSYLFQSEAKTWSLVIGQGTRACIIGGGNSGSPMVIGRDA